VQEDPQYLYHPQQRSKRKDLKKNQNRQEKQYVIPEILIAAVAEVSNFLWIYGFHGKH
jgi:hypothetical protein